MKNFFSIIIFSAILAMALPLAAQEKTEPANDAPVNTPTNAPGNYIRFLPQPPKTLTLCGEKVPLDDPFIAEQLDREFNTMVHDQAQMVMYLKRAGRYFPYISRELKAAGLPDDLKYLAVTESLLLHYIKSPAGALGLWQFMPATGRQYNLKINDTIDERLNPEKSTHAAIAYFKYLHRIFKNWALVMAAYNCGEGRIGNELKEQGATTYYELYLPRETMRYVFRIMAVKIILSDPEAYGYYLPPEQIYKPLQGDEITLELGQTTHLREPARLSKSSVRYLRELNPELLTNNLPKGSYTLLMPKGQGAAVLRGIKQEQTEQTSRPQQPSREQAHRVTTGDTLSAVAAKYGVSMEAIKRANKLKDNNIKIGQKLIIPAY